LTYSFGKNSFTLDETDRKQELPNDFGELEQFGQVNLAGCAGK